MPRNLPNAASEPWSLEAEGLIKCHLVYLREEKHKFKVSVTEMEMDFSEREIKSSKGMEKFVKCFPILNGNHGDPYEQFLHVYCLNPFKSFQGAGKVGDN